MRGPSCQCHARWWRRAALASALRAQVVPPYWTVDSPVDTCGAGDAYVAGLLFSYLSGFDLAAMGRTGARVASAVISRPGACLTMQVGWHSACLTCVKNVGLGARGAHQVLGADAFCEVHSLVLRTCLGSWGTGGGDNRCFIACQSAT